MGGGIVVGRGWGHWWRDWGRRGYTRVPPQVMEGLGLFLGGCSRGGRCRCCYAGGQHGQGGFMAGDAHPSPPHNPLQAPFTPLNPPNPIHPQCLHPCGGGTARPCSCGPPGLASLMQGGQLLPQRRSLAAAPPWLGWCWRHPRHPAVVDSWAPSPPRSSEDVGGAHGAGACAGGAKATGWGSDRVSGRLWG